MGFLDQAKQLAAQIKQKAQSVVQSPTIKNAASFVSKPLVQQVNDRVQSQGGYQAAVQRVLQPKLSYNLGSQIAQGQFLNQPNLAAQTGRDYIQNRIITPAANVPKYTAETFDPSNGKSGIQRLGSAANALMSTGQLGLGLTPAGVGWSAYDAAKGHDLAKRTGGNTLTGLTEGLSGKIVPSLGESQTGNKLGAAALNVAEFAVPIAHSLQTAKSLKLDKLAKGISEDIGTTQAEALKLLRENPSLSAESGFIKVGNNFRIVHPEDRARMVQLIDYARNNKGGPMDHQLELDASRLAQHYGIDGGKTLSSLANKFDNVLADIKQVHPNRWAGQAGFARLGGEATDAKPLSAENTLSETTKTLQQRTQELLKPPSEQPLKQIEVPGTTPDTQKYLDSLVQKQGQARGEQTPSLVQKGQSFLADIKKKFVDSAAPIEDLLTEAENKNKFKVRPTNDVRLQIDRVLRSNTLAGQFAKDNGLDKVIRDAPNLDALNQYLIAKQASKVSGLGIKTGRDITKDAQLIKELGPQYESYAQKVTQYGQKVLDYSVQSGLIDKETATALKQKYPDYVPLNRVFGELEKGHGLGSKAVASLGSQSVVQELKGSTREIEDPIGSLLGKTADAFTQGEKNIAAKQLASYKDLPGFEGLITELKPGEGGVHTFSYLDNGVKKTFATTPEIAAAAKSLDKEQIGLLGKIFRVPTRILQVGATGLNLPFAASNLAKDQITAFVNSNHAASTSLLNPANFVRSLFSAVKHDDLYQEVVRNAAGGTSFDIARSEPNLTVEGIRAGKNLGSKIAYTVKNPGELMRSVEDIIGRSEEATRIQNYKGAYDSLIKQGRTVQDARLLAAQQARENTTNFARSGDWGKVLNAAIPFFNAGIQGSRKFITQMKEHPVQTGAKIAAAGFFPVATATAWNLSDPNRAAAYRDIRDFEKENNLIIVPPNPVKNDKGQWNVIKIPMSQELTNLNNIVRRSIETSKGLDPIKFQEIAGSIIGSTTSLNVSSPRQVVSQLTPQLIKPGIEAITNTNLFTGNKIVPEALKNLPASEQVKPTTSGTARLIGKFTGSSPLQLENAVSTAAGGVGTQLLNTSDTALNKLGMIPSEQVSGENAGQNFNRRFTKASGGQEMTNAYAQQDKTDQATKNALKAYVSGDKAKAKEIITKNGIVLTTRQVENYQKNTQRKIADLYITNKKSAKTLSKESGVSITQGDVQKAAKKKAVELYKLGLKGQAKKIVDEYKIQLTNRDVQ